MKEFRKTLTPGISALVLPLLLAAAALAFSCTSASGPDDSFTASDKIRAYSTKTGYSFEYNPLSCQMSSNRERLEFRMFKDDVCDYFCITLDKWPSQQGQTVTASVKYTSTYDITELESVQMEVSRLEGDTLWLWSSKEQLGAVVKLL